VSLNGTRINHCDHLNELVEAAARACASELVLAYASELELTSGVASLVASLFAARTLTPIVKTVTLAASPARSETLPDEEQWDDAFFADMLADERGGLAHL
jgi:hypothetical protein